VPCRFGVAATARAPRSARRPGPLVATDGNGAVLVAQGLRPGDSRVGEVTVVNAGDTSGALALSQADRVDSPTPAGPLSAVLDLAVVDLTAGRTVFSGTLGALQNVALGDFAKATRIATASWSPSRAAARPRSTTSSRSRRRR